MFVDIIFRNIKRNFKRNRPILFMLCISFVVLTIVNSVALSLSSTFFELYTKYLTSDMSISKNEGDFTIFGSTVLFVGNFLTPPIIPDIENVIDIVDNNAGIENWAGVLTLPVELRHEEQGISTPHVAFGVDFESYFQLFPDIQLHSGYFPDSSSAQASIMLQLHQHERLGSPEIGSTLIVLSSDGYNYNFREVLLSAVYSYPAEDSLMKGIVLVDANTVRSLAGYVSEPRVLQDIPAEERDLATAEIDDIFSVDEALNLDVADESGLQIDDVERILSVTEDRPASRAVVETAWHFILLDSADDYPFFRAQSDLQEKGYRLLNWRDTAGGEAQIVFFLQILLSSGVGILIVGASLVIINAIMLSILERAKEIATMRAIGATKLKVASIIAIEILLTVFLTAFIGTLIGIFLVPLINRMGITPSNRYIQLLAGGGTIRGVVTSTLLLFHLGLSLVLSVLCTLYPLSKTLRFLPRQAME